MLYYRMSGINPISNVYFSTSSTKSWVFKTISVVNMRLNSTVLVIMQNYPTLLPTIVPRKNKTILSDSSTEQ